MYTSTRCTPPYIPINLWFSGADKMCLFSGFQEIGAITGCVTMASQMNPADNANTVLHWLTQLYSWLLVIDNVDIIVHGYLPAMACKGHMIITSRNPDAAEIPAIGIKLPVLSEEAAIEFLRIRSNVDNTECSPNEQIEAAKIVKELGCLALAIDQAAVIIRSLLESISMFPPMYHEFRKQVLAQESPVPGSGTYPRIRCSLILVLQVSKEWNLTRY